MPAKHKAKGMEILRASVPASTYAWFVAKAEREGVSVQSLVAPVLNAVARGEVRGGFELVPSAHGNAKGEAAR